MTILSICQCNKTNKLTPYTFKLREGWEAPDIPGKNPLTKESIALGKSLFFETALSIDSTVSCASCHHAQFGFADDKPLSLGVMGRTGLRNSGTLTNIAYLPYFNRDGGVRTLDIFASVPLQDHDEMGFNLLLAGERMRTNEEYNKVSKKVYRREIDGFVITRSIASFLRTFISDNSRYDKIMGNEKGQSFTEAEKKGKALFYGSKGKCSSCHSGNQFTNYTFQNNGLYESYKNKDRGRERVTLDPVDEGRFRVATLRNVELTAPYMHDGSLPTLKSVLQHYSSKGSSHKNKNSILNEINLTPEEEDDIIAFLKTLTDHEFITNPDFTQIEN
ncbi:MAG: cytochrome c peroxidase [Bacteroidota bacterium]